jgi:hypothetical protein
MLTDFSGSGCDTVVSYCEHNSELGFPKNAENFLTGRVIQEGLFCMEVANIYRHITLVRAGLFVTRLRPIRASTTSSFFKNNICFLLLLLLLLLLLAVVVLV